MGLFSLTQEIAIDLGTANTIIIHNDKIVVDQPSVVALDRRTDKLIAVGERARQMQGKVHEDIRTVRPLRDGVIADFYAAELMIRGMCIVENSGWGATYAVPISSLMVEYYLRRKISPSRQGLMDKMEKTVLIRNYGTQNKVSTDD